MSNGSAKIVKKLKLGGRNGLDDTARPARCWRLAAKGDRLPHLLP
jgi:hypothetical protein